MDADIPIQSMRQALPWGDMQHVETALIRRLDSCICNHW